MEELIKKYDTVEERKQAISDKIDEEFNNKNS
jgi:hypothetical protein